MPPHAEISTNAAETIFPAANAQLTLRKLSVQEWRRRAWHFFPGFLVLAATQIPKDDPLLLWPLSVTVVLGMGLIVGASLRYHSTFRRYQSESPLVMAFGYALPIITLLFLFRDRAEIALAATGIIAFGDGSATLVGLLCGGPKLPWNARKTISGAAAFAVFGTLAASLIYWLEAKPELSYGTAFAITAPAAIGCALIESTVQRWNDNAVVSTSAATLLVLLTFLVERAFT